MIKLYDKKGQHILSHIHLKVILGIKFHKALKKMQGYSLQVKILTSERSKMCYAGLKYYPFYYCSSLSKW